MGVLRYVGMAAALATAIAPFAARAQECLAEDSPCAADGPCPLNSLPYEEFIAAPPATRGRYDVPPVAERPFDPDSGDKILVRRFVVENVNPNPDQGITQETVQAATDASFKQQVGDVAEARMTVGQMQRVSDEVTTFYRNSGYLVAKAFIPVQTIGADAVVHIQVMEGRVSDITVENASDYSVELLRKPSAGLVGATPIRDSVESALLYTQDYPGVRLFGTFRPGAQTGDTSLVLQVLEEDSFGFSVGGDNYGNEFTGTYRMRGDAAWKNPVGWGDELNLTFLQAVAPENTTFGSLGYRVPVGPRGFGIFVEGSHNAFVVDDGPLGLLDLEGTISVYQAGMDWRFVRERFLNMRAGLSAAQKNSDLTILTNTILTEDKYTVANLELNLERVDTRFRGVDLGLMKIRQGLGGELKSGGAQLPTDFTILDLHYTRFQALTETQQLLFRARTQFTGDRLSPLEQFSLSGPDTVRAYPVGQSLQDIGYFTSLEYRVQAPGFARVSGPFGRTWGDLLQFSLFADYAYGDDAKLANASSVLSGAGAGVQFGVPGTFQILLQGSNPLSSAVANDGEDFRFYGQFSVQF